MGGTRVFTALAAAALALTAHAAPPASIGFMPVSEIRPGMTGVGRTVFSESERAEFTVRVLGVLRNVIAPRRDLILARLEGGPLAHTGVLEGMSGSPVYIDGRLVGAVSYSLGSFPKEPIAGITPIAEMTDAVAAASPRALATRPFLDLPVTPERLTAALRAMYQRVRPFADRPGDLDSIGLPRAAAVLGAQLRPIATPMVISGFSGDAWDLLRDAFQGAGFSPLSGEFGQRDATAPGALQPGDALGVSLLRGDYELGATGTVTHVDGSRVYAFGHPFFNLGPTQFPMTRARVQTLLPSLMTSSKIAAIGEVIGTVEQDRATAIGGALGPGPRMMPVTLELDDGRGAARTLRFEIAHDEFFTPLLTFLTVTSSLTAYERQVGSATFAIRGSARVAGHGAIAYEDVVSGPDAVSAAASYIAGPVVALMSNPLGPVRFDGVDLSIEASEKLRTATLERAWIDEVRPRAGQAVTLKLLVRAYGGDEQVHAVRVPLPPNSPASLSILVADGPQLQQWEQRELKRSDQVQTIAQMMGRFSNAPRHDRLYVRLFGASPGAVVNGEPLPSLPPSVLSVLDAERAGGRVAPIRSAVLGSWEVPAGRAVSGSRVLTVNIEPAR
jgi:hypothetical protein